MTVSQLVEHCLNNTCSYCEHQCECAGLGVFITKDDYSCVLPYLMQKNFIKLLDRCIYFDDEGLIQIIKRD